MQSGEQGNRFIQPRSVHTSIRIYVHSFHGQSAAVEVRQASRFYCHNNDSHNITTSDRLGVTNSMHSYITYRENGQSAVAAAAAADGKSNR